MATTNQNVGYTAWPKNRMLFATSWRTTFIPFTRSKIFNSYDTDDTMLYDVSPQFENEYSINVSDNENDMLRLMPQTVGGADFRVNGFSDISDTELVSASETVCLYSPDICF